MKYLLSLSCILASLVGGQVCAEEPASYTITIKDHQFHPQRLEVAARQRIKLSIVNQDATPEEFESHELNREKLIKAGATSVIYLSPLTPGEYPYYGEFHPKDATGMILAK